MTFRVLLVGAGAMGKNHARVIRDVEGLDLVAVVDENGDGFGIAQDIPFYKSLTELELDLIDVAVVATPTSTHEKLSEELFAHSINVLVEKPIAQDLKSASRMQEKMQLSHGVGAVGHIERFNPAIQELRRRLKNGEIGEVHQIATRRQSSFPSRVGDVGVTKDLATHDIELTSWIMDTTYDFVFAQTACKSGRDYEDMIAVTGRLKSGVIVNHVVNWLSPMKERVVVVTGDKGTLIADTVTGDLTLHENGAFLVDWDSFASFRGVTEGNVTRFAFPKKEPLKAEWEGFRDYLVDGSGQIVSFSEGIEVLRVAEAIIRSEEKGLPCKINEIL